jgi:uncharacterized membrane protein
LSVHPRERILRAIDDRRAVRLTGNRHPLARPEFDQGGVAPDQRLSRMILSLSPDYEQTAALENLIQAQHDPASPLYQRWLSPQEFESRFGVSPNDVRRVTQWLEKHGLTVDELPAGGRSVIFSGSAAQVRATFRTDVRQFRVGGQLHVANANDPWIPDALVGVVNGIVTMNDFGRKPLHSERRVATADSPIAPLFTSGNSHYLSPGDFATIYNLTPLYGSGIDGTGQTIAIVGRSNIRVSDVRSFRSSFGLPAKDPVIVLNGPDPGPLGGGEETEADLDVQWSGAVAPKATVKFVVSASTQTTDGVDLSAQYIVSHNVAPVLSVSFGLCEAFMGPSELAFYNNLWQQAAAQGITAFISSGDSGAAGCDGGSASTASYGRGVNGLCSSPYSVCVGGSQFNEGGSPGLYWSSSNGSGAGQSALSYIPEVAWNESGSNGGSGLWATGGGASIAFTKPSWQTGAGVPADGKRDVPDVSLTAAGHDGYLIAQGGYLWSIGGTSASSPAFAGLMALVNQSTGSRQGNANTRFYALAANQSSGGAAVFHAMTGGNNTVPGVTGFATAGSSYNQATGLGTVDAAMMVNHWNDGASAGGPSKLTLTVPRSISIVAGASDTAKITVGVASGFSSAVTLSLNGLPAGVTATFSKPTLAAPGAGASVLTISASSTGTTGQFNLQITAAGGGQSTNATIAVTVLASFALQASAPTLTVQQGASAKVTLTTQGGSGFNSAITYSITGVPQGLTASFATNPVPAPGAAADVLTLSASASANPGSYPLMITASGGGVAQTARLTVTIPAPPCVLTLSSSTLLLQRGASSTVQVSCISKQAPTNLQLQLSVPNLPSGVTVSFNPTRILANTGKSVAAISVSAAAATTTSTLLFTGSGAAGSTPAVAALPLTVYLPGDFTLGASPSGATILQGTSASVTVSTAHTGGFNSAINLLVSGLPSGVRASWSKTSIGAPGDGSSTLTLQADTTARTGSFNVTITASSPVATHTTGLVLVVTPLPNFTLSAGSAGLKLVPSAQGSVTLQVSSIVGGFNAPVTLSIPGSLPAGVTASLSKSSFPAPGGGTSTLQFQIAPGTTVGTYPITVSATGGGITKTASVSLQVAVPTFQLTVTPSATLFRGSSYRLTAVTTGSNGFNSPVTLSISPLPTGVTATFAPQTIQTPSGTSAITLKATSTATTGYKSITITGKSGSITQTATVNLTLR